MADAALRLDGVSAGYGSRPVVRDVSFEVRRGEIVALLGANGCGKTTLLRVAAGALRPTAGTVRLAGLDPAVLGPRETARRLALLPQDAGPVFPVTALEVVLLGRAPWRPTFAFESQEDIDAASASLAAVDAAALADRRIDTLSGGELQRVLLARALCQGGEVLVSDEPTAHLDLAGQGDVWSLLARQAADGRAVLVVTHDVNLAAQAADRLVLLAPADGAGVTTVIASGSPRDVLTAATLGRAFGTDLQVGTGPDGAPYVLRRLEHLQTQRTE